MYYYCYYYYYYYYYTVAVCISATVMGLNYYTATAWRESSRRREAERARCAHAGLAPAGDGGRGVEGGCEDSG